MKIKCVICGSDFEPYNGNAKLKYCSYDCRRIHYLNYYKNYYKKNRDKLSEIKLKNYYEKSKYETPQKKCKYCNETVYEKYKHFHAKCVLERAIENLKKTESLSLKDRKLLARYNIPIRKALEGYNKMKNERGEKNGRS